MPNLEEHCLHSLKRYGVRGDDIHSWMDEPSQVSGASHRNYRHGLESLPIAIQVFGEKYGEEMVENIFLDHLKADSEENRRKKSDLVNPSFGWSQEEDDFLISNFLTKVEDLETAFRGKWSRKDIQNRRKFLGLITPRVFRYKQRRLLKVIFSLEREKKLFYKIDILLGGKKDIDFGIGESKKQGNSFNFEFERRRIQETINSVYIPTYTGKHEFNFSNLFSVWSTKTLRFAFNLENGREMAIRFEV